MDWILLRWGLGIVPYVGGRVIGKEGWGATVGLGGSGRWGTSRWGGCVGLWEHVKNRLSVFHGRNDVHALRYLEAQQSRLPGKTQHIAACKNDYQTLPHGQLAITVASFDQSKYP